MLEIDGQLKKWGNSFAFRVSKDKIKRNKMRINQKFRLLVVPESNVLKKTFGTAKFKKSTEEMMKETDRLLYND